MSQSAQLMRLRAFLAVDTQVRSVGSTQKALRCGQISQDGQSIRIYAGCGIVAGSDPEREYAESQAKLLPMRSALEKH
jgi:isochorismate synthase EntC